MEGSVQLQVRVANMQDSCLKKTHVMELMVLLSFYKPNYFQTVSLIAGCDLCIDIKQMPCKGK